MGNWNKRVFTSILIILFSILFASSVDSQSDEEKSIASIPFIQVASVYQETQPTGYIVQESYSGTCKFDPYPEVICIAYSDGYVWLLPGYVIGSSENIQEDGKNVQVYAGNDVRYYHVLNTNFVKIDSLMTQGTQGYIEQKPYGGDCDAKPSWTECIAYSDGYILLVTDSVLSWEDVEEDGKNVQVAVGNDARYYHVLNPNLVGFGPLELERSLEISYNEQKPHSKDCGERRSGTVCAKYSDGYVWLIADSVLRWEEIQQDGKSVEIVVGNKVGYYHVLNPNLVKIGPLITQAAPEPAPEPAPELDPSSRSVYG